MKTPEDEAFEEIERRQGGFPAKRAMAADKLQEPLHVVQSNGKHSPLLTHMMNKRTISSAQEQDEADLLDIAYKNGYYDGKKATLAQPAQEPVGMLHIDRLDKWLDASLKERKQRQWIGLTDEETRPIIHKAMVYYGYDPEHATLTSGAGFHLLAESIEQLLKEKNG